MAGKMGIHHYVIDLPMPRV